MPNRSKASRSNQLALAHTSTTESTTGSAESSHLTTRQPLVVADGEQLIDDREAAGGVRVGRTALRHAAAAEARAGGIRGLPLLAPVGQISGAGKIHQHLEGELGRMGECRAPLGERARVGVVGQLAGERGPAPDAAAEPRVDLQGESFVELAQALSHSSSDYRAIVLVRAIFFCSCTIPYTSASAVGAHPGT